MTVTRTDDERRRWRTLDTTRYDVFIVGGGTAGAVVASRLSADPDVRVCLIEGGPSDVGDDNVLVLRNWLNLLESKYDYHDVGQSRGSRAADR